MKQWQYYIRANWTVQFCAVLLSIACMAQTNDPLAQRVNRGDKESFLEAGKKGRKDLIPVLENFANVLTNPLDQDRIAARMALAKLGARKYLDDFIADWTSTNSPTFKFYRENYEGLGTRRADADSEAELTAKFVAMQRLVYIGDKSTVKYVAVDLYNTNRPHRHPLSGNFLESRTPIVALAARTLSEMHLENAPQPSAEGDPESLNHIEAWKNWWEQNKDKYP